MKVILILLFLTVPTLYCQSQELVCLAEIGFIYTCDDEKERQEICKIYEENRKLFFHFKNEDENYGTRQITEMFVQAQIPQKTIDIFMDRWYSLATEHRNETTKRDSSFLEGVLCLSENIEQWSNDLRAFLTENEVEVKLCLTDNQIGQIQTGIRDYRNFNKRKKRQFFEEETMMFGELGKNIIEYNQLSFDLIDSIMTSQYHFGFKDNYFNKLLSFYNKNPKLNSMYEEYRILEEKIVGEVTSERCFKRIGIIRFYDELSNEEKERAIKVNMLMNFFR